MYSTVTNMRNIIGDMTLDEVLAGRDTINFKTINYCRYYYRCLWNKKYYL